MDYSFLLTLCQLNIAFGVVVEVVVLDLSLDLPRSHWLTVLVVVFSVS